MDYTIILLIVNVFAAVTVIALTLIQQPKGDMGSAFGGGGSQSMFGSRGSANFLTKSTSWMCFIFFASSLMLAYFYAQKNNSDVVADESVIEEVTDLPSIVEATDTTVSEESDLPSLQVGEAAELVEQAAEDGATIVEEAVDSAQQAAEEASDVINDAVEDVIDEE